MKGKNEERGSFPKIGKPAERALGNAGYSKLGQLAKRTEGELLELHGVGPKAIRILKAALKAEGLSFKKQH